MRFQPPARRRALLAMAGLCLSTLFGVAHAAEPLKAVASFSILGDIVREVGGKDVDVATLVGPDGDAHEYEPTPGDAKKPGRRARTVRQRPGFRDLDAAPGEGIRLWRRHRGRFPGGEGA